MIERKRRDDYAGLPLGPSAKPSQRQQDSEIGDVSCIGQDMIYPRHVLYIFTHLTLWTEDKTLLDESKKTLETWKTWDWPTMIQEHKSIRDDLLRFRKSLSSQPDLHADSLLRKPLTANVFDAVCWTVAVPGDTEYINLHCLDTPHFARNERLLSTCEDSVIFLFPAYKNRYVQPFIKLCRASGLICYEMLSGKLLFKQDFPIIRVMGINDSDGRGRDGGGAFCGVGHNV